MHTAHHPGMKRWGVLLAALLAAIPAPATQGGNCVAPIGAHAAAFSPDGAVLATVLPEGACPQWRVGISYRGDQIRSLDAPGGAASSLSWSPHGRYVVAGVIIATRTAVVVFDTEMPSGRQQKMIAEGRDPAWSPDGLSIAYSDMTGGLHVVAPDGTNDRRVAAGDRPAWSPDASRLAYHRQGSIFVANRDGSAGHRLTAGERASWSPDGGWVAVLREDAAYVLRSDGSEERRMGLGAPIQWSPSGDEIALLDDAGVFRLVSVSTGRSRRVAEDVAAATMDADWDRVATVLRVGRRSEVYVAHGAYHFRRTASQCRLYTANCVDGTDRADHINGTALRDVIFPGAGDDRIRTFEGDDRIDTAYGRDYVAAGAGNDIVVTHGNDDRIIAGPGIDHLYPGNGEDVVDGGRGGDWIDASGDGRVDVVRCGAGRDAVHADTVDRIARDCERVIRRR
jgi:hypothetical protein